MKILTAVIAAILFIGTQGQAQTPPTATEIAKLLPWFQAVHEDSPDDVIAALKGGADITTTDGKDRNAAHIAALLLTRPR